MKKRVHEEAEGRRFPYGFVIKLALSVLFVVIIANKVDLRQIWEAFKTTNIGLFLFSFLFILVGEIPVAMRLKLLIGPSIVQVRLLRLLQVDLIGRFYAFFLPGGLATTISRWYKITGNKVGRGQFIMVLIVEKSFFFAVALIVVAVPLLLLDDPRAQAIKAAFMPVGFALSSLLLVFYACLIIPPVQDIFVLHINERIRGLLSGKAKDLWEKVTNAAMIYRGHWRVFSCSLLISFFVQACLFIQFFLLFLAVQVELPIFTVLWMSSLVFLIQTLPITLAGIGVREYGFAYLLGLYGIAPEKGVVIGLLFMAHLIIQALIGGIFELMDKDSLPAGTT